MVLQRNKNIQKFVAHPATQPTATTALGESEEQQQLSVKGGII